MDVVRNRMHLFFIPHTAHMQVILFILLFFLLGQLSAAEIIGKVVSVADGDTITILDDMKIQHRVRLARIDAPEKGQPYGTKARQYLSSLIFGKPVKVTYKSKDRYKRILGIVYYDGQDINLIMVQQGMAWHYSYYDRTEEYAEVEKQARRLKIGLWADPDPIPPYEYRQSKKRPKMPK